MATDVDLGIERLKTALEILSRPETQGDWYEAYEIADKKFEETGSDDWKAVRALIVVATHGEPYEISYLDKSWDEIIGKKRS